MADFCKQCSEKIFGRDEGDLRGLCKKDEIASVICEGCGFIYVNADGECVSDCLAHHCKPANE